MTQLKIKAEVNAPGQNLSYTPLQADFGEVVVGKKRKFTIELTNDDSTKCKINIVDWPCSEFIKKTKLKKDKLKPGKTTKIEFELSKKIPVGRFNTSISLQVEDNPKTRITIPVKGSIITEQPKPKAKDKTDKGKDQTKTKAGK